MRVLYKIRDLLWMLVRAFPPSCINTLVYSETCTQQKTWRRGCIAYWSVLYTDGCYITLYWKSTILKFIDRKKNCGWTVWELYSIPYWSNRYIRNQEWDYNSAEARIKKYRALTDHHGYHLTSMELKQNASSFLNSPNKEFLNEVGATEHFTDGFYLGIGTS